MSGGAARRRLAEHLRASLVAGEAAVLSQPEISLALAALTASLERTATAASALLACDGCGWLVRVSRRLADAGPHRCLACHGVLEER